MTFSTSFGGRLSRAPLLAAVLLLPTAAWADFLVVSQNALHLGQDGVAARGLGDPAVPGEPPELLVRELLEQEQLAERLHRQPLRALGDGHGAPR